MNKCIRGVVLVCVLLVACVDTDRRKNRQIEHLREVSQWPVVASAVQNDPQIEEKIRALLAKMSLEQKVGQMIQPEIRDVSPEDVKRYFLGSVLNGGGAFPENDKYATISDWLAMLDRFYLASVDTSEGGLGIPLLWGTDAVHGHNNVVGATLYPHNIALGATGNAELIKKMGIATAKEVAVTGVDWVFAPTVAVVRDDRWGRSYEGYSEDPEIVTLFAKQMVEGLQGEGNQDNLLEDYRVLATAKHFIGDGGTNKGDDQGDNVQTEEQLIKLHAQGYFSSIGAGVQTVMASFNSWQGEKLHGHHYLLTQVLKKRMGFDGFVVGDWNGHGQVAGCKNESCPQAINAGVDMLMVPEDWKALYHNTIEQVRSGKIAQSRIDDAVTRILRVKFRAQLFNKPKPSARPWANKVDVMGGDAHRKLARQAVRESLVLLKNKNTLLPLKRKLKVLISGDGANNIGKQSGGWTLSWQGSGNKNSDFPNATSIYQGIKNVVEGAGGQVVLSNDASSEALAQDFDVAIVVYGENPYAEGQGDVDTLEYQAGYHSDLALLNKIKKNDIPIVSLFLSGRPLWVNKELNVSDAFVAAWLPGSEGAGIADVIFRNNQGKSHYDFVGKLSFSWPATPMQFELNRFDKNYQPLFPYGFGLSYQDVDSLGDNLSEEGAAKAQTGAEVLPLFVGRALAPWHLVLSDSQFDNVPADVGQAAADVVSIVPVDKDIQADARKIVWNGKGLGAFSLRSSSKMNYSASLRQYASLVFDLRVDRAATREVMLRMCGSTCAGKQNITNLVAEKKLGVWSRVSISLACFSTMGVDFTQITRPFELETAGELALSVANIQWIPGSVGDDSLEACLS